MKYVEKEFTKPIKSNAMMVILKMVMDVIVIVILKNFLNVKRIEKLKEVFVKILDL